MIPQIGVLPPVGSPFGGATTNAEPTQRPSDATKGETTASKAVPTARSIDAPIQTASVSAPVAQPRTEMLDLSQPDPEAPVGPKPTFEKSPLEREQELATVVARADAAAEAKREAQIREAVRSAILTASTTQADVPPTPAEKIETDVTTIRAIGSEPLAPLES